MTQTSTVSRLPAILIGLAALVLASLLAARMLGDRDAVAKVGGGTSVSPSGADAAEWGAFPEFELVSQERQTVTRDDLLGTPFVACAVFTNCTGPCPGITGQMQELQEVFQDLDVKLVSITVDPLNDTPERFGEYAASYDADPERWLFLTGSEKAVDALVSAGFFLSVDRGGREITHDKRLVAVDAKGRRRGWYDGTDPEAIVRLKSRMRALAAEASL
ncbi:MAG: SCO family protein [Planctomycetota bacterium]